LYYKIMLQRVIPPAIDSGFIKEVADQANSAQAIENIGKYMNTVLANTKSRVIKCNNGVVCMKFMIEPSDNIRSSTLRDIWRNGNGLVKDTVIDMYGAKGKSQLTIYLYDRIGDETSFDDHEPHCVMLNNIVDLSAYNFMSKMDRINVATIMNHVYRMRGALPYLKTIVENNDRQCVIKIVGLDEIKHSFLNYLVEELSKTFIESYSIQLNKLHLEGIAALQNLMLQIHLRKAGEEIKYIHVAVDDDLPGMKRSRDVDETDNEKNKRL
jgi:hypothetical protein